MPFRKHQIFTRKTKKAHIHVTSKILRSIANQQSAGISSCELEAYRVVQDPHLRPERSSPSSYSSECSRSEHDLSRLVARSQFEPPYAQVCKDHQISDELSKTIANGV